MEKIGLPLDYFYDFKVRSDFTPSQSSPYYAEYFWGLEKASNSELHRLVSLVTPLTLNSISTDETVELNNFYFFNKNAREVNLVLLRNSISHEIQGYVVYIVFVEYFLPNNNTKENEYNVLCGFAIADGNLRNKRIFEVFSDLYIYPYSIKNIGKNCVFLDVSINPVSYKYISENCILFPSYYRQTPRLVEDFMLTLMKKYGYVSLSEEKPFVVKDLSLIDLNANLWRKNYHKLSKDSQFYIDQTDLIPGWGLMFFTFSNLLQGNTLALPVSQYSFKKGLPEILVKEFYFQNPKL